MTDRQQQKGGANSLVVQAGGDVTVGLTYDEAERLAMRVFESRLGGLASEAADLVIERVQAFDSRLMSRLTERDIGWDALRDPDVQRRLNGAQVTYASSGDVDVAEVLIELLSERFAEAERSRRQVIVSEALAVVDKLTVVHADALAVIFLLSLVRAPSVRTDKDLQEWAQKLIGPVAAGLPTDGDLDFRHLRYAGCADRVFHDVSLEARLRDLFPNLDLEANSENSLTDLFYAAAEDELEPLRSAWDGLALNRLRLTPVGLAIGHSNARRRGGFQAPLAIWIR